ncbi:hypothetical protein [Streptomyces neyagawaensis]|uniref:Uncharacterized protein n=1 Tax=Streptomyces neyagawaensis TaxID=42238 RepID=A0ABV3ATT8_9ACTN
MRTPRDSAADGAVRGAHGTHRSFRSRRHTRRVDEAVRPGRGRELPSADALCRRRLAPR